MFHAGKHANEIITLGSDLVDPVCRVASAFGMGSLEDSDNRIAILRKLMRDSDPGVRKVAIRSVARAGASELLDELRDIVDDTSNTSQPIRDEARNAINGLTGGSNQP